jgi:hypothetical protein
VPQIIEQPLARLRNAHQWEQRPANKALVNEGFRFTPGIWIFKGISWWFNGD